MRVPVVQHRARRRALRWRVLWAGGEVLCTVGVLLLLLVVHQLWWTNREARAGAERKVEALEREWGAGTATAPLSDGASGGGSGSGADSAGGSSGTSSGTSASAASSTYGKGGGTGQRPATDPRPRWSQAYAIITIPRLDLRAPIAEGVGKQDVLNKGYVGHYPGTQQPGQAGNFALAGHRNTHGEPFRYLNHLRTHDTVEVETRAAVYTYVVDKILPQTSAQDGGVIRPVPRSTTEPAYGYSQPGYYITLTTCTPEYTSRYRLVVWGKLVSMRPR
ncbi:class E sortase [Streptomyces sp. Li-HN-5-11]|uniref:class E sortase n=1 Tax=Streptomyces sp. Li-HN-5-11 TaxID=3075432 RepID=UPI0028A79984|nr:class E sortase [Streptomyces sp. Li-HN-5-11]WNM35336.1 class E sortase [Streptomyces sp. Li-HN-5-11]